MLTNRLCIFAYLFLHFFALPAQDKGMYITNTNNNTNRKDRMALVIGNSNYTGEGKLRNPGNDADKMSAVLKELGFTVWTAKNLSLRKMDSLMDAWGNKIKEYEVALFYYSGHGAEAAGENYLFPIDANPNSESDVKYECYAVNKLVGKMNYARTTTNILLLDACRNNPFQRSWHRDAGGGGLANMQVPRGIFFGFSTSPGSTADDGTGSNSPYVTSMLNRIKECNSSIDDIFTDVNSDVQQFTNNRQVPYKGGTLNGKFYFCTNEKTTDTKPAPVTATPKTETKPAPVATTQPDNANTDNTLLNDLSPAIQKLVKDMVRIPGGTFWMGCNSEEDDECEDNELQHKVTLTGFKMGKYEVTQAQYAAVMGSNPSKFTGCPKCPVEQVSWNDVQEFIKKLNQLTGMRFRLPTEAEWEYACHAGTTTKFNTGNCLSTSEANYNGNYPAKNCGKGTYYEKTKEVGSYNANAYGLYDMHGNVWEWCSDWYGTYEAGAQTNPKGAASGTIRVGRGGSWYDYGRNCRSSNRSNLTPDDRDDCYYGFRLAQD